MSNELIIYEGQLSKSTDLIIDDSKITGLKAMSGMTCPYCHTPKTLNAMSGQKGKRCLYQAKCDECGFTYVNTSRPKDCSDVQMGFESKKFQEEAEKVLRSGIIEHKASSLKRIK